MSSLLAAVILLVEAGDVRISVHGYRRLAAALITVNDLVMGIRGAEIVEEYPTYHAGPAVLTLQSDNNGSPIHVLWGIERNTLRPAVVVTAYRPDPNRWSPDFRKRLP